MSKRISSMVRDPDFQQRPHPRVAGRKIALNAAINRFHRRLRAADPFLSGFIASYVSLTIPDDL
jgi:hypothetical protein